MERRISPKDTISTRNLEATRNRAPSDHGLLRAWIAVGALAISGCAAGESGGPADAIADAPGSDVHDAGWDAADAPDGVTGHTDASDGSADTLSVVDVGTDAGTHPDVAPDVATIADGSAIDAGTTEDGTDTGSTLDAGTDTASTPDVVADTGATDAGPADTGPTVCGPLTVTCPTGCCPVPSVDLAPTGAFPSVAVDPTGYLYVSYTVTIAASATWLAIFNPTTATWSTTMAGLGSRRSVVRVDATGRVHHLYGVSAGSAGSTSSSFVTYRFSDDHGATWTSRSLGGVLAADATLDLAIGASSTPYVVYERDNGVFFAPDLVYATWTGTSWTAQVLDPGNGDRDPVIALGFADRPHVLVNSGSGATSSMRHVFYDGSAWVAETIESGQYYGSAGTSLADPYLDGQLEVLPDDSVRAVYPRATMPAETTSLALATRTSGATGTWTIAAIPGITGRFSDAWYASNVGGTPAIVASGLTTYRAGSTGTFVPTVTGLLGTGPGIAVVGSSMYVAYTSSATPTNGHLLFSLLTP